MTLMWGISDIFKDFRYVPLICLVRLGGVVSMSSGIGSQFYWRAQVGFPIDGGDDLNHEVQIWSCAEGRGAVVRGNRLVVSKRGYDVVVFVMPEVRVTIGALTWFQMFSDEAEGSTHSSDLLLSALSVLDPIRSNDERLPESSIIGCGDAELVFPLFRAVSPAHPFRECLDPGRLVSLDRPVTSQGSEVIQ